MGSDYNEYKMRQNKRRPSNAHQSDVAAGCAAALVVLLWFVVNVAFWGWVGYLMYFWVAN